MHLDVAAMSKYAKNFLNTYTYCLYIWSVYLYLYDLYIYHTYVMRLVTNSFKTGISLWNTHWIRKDENYVRQPNPLSIVQVNASSSFPAAGKHQMCVC